MGTMEVSVRIISLFLVPWVISIAVTVLFSYLIVGSSKLLSQPLSFVPSPAHFKEKGSESGVQVSGTWLGESQ